MFAGIGYNLLETSGRLLVFCSGMKPICSFSASCIYSRTLRFACILATDSGLLSHERRVICRLCQMEIWLASPVCSQQMPWQNLSQDVPCVNVYFLGKLNGIYIHTFCTCFWYCNFLLITNIYMYGGGGNAAGVYSKIKFPVFPQALLPVRQWDISSSFGGTSTSSLPTLIYK